MARQEKTGIFPKTTALIEDYRKSGYFPDVSYALFTPKEVLLRGSGGHAGPETWFDLASLTKVFVATAVLQLAAEGRLSLEEPVDFLLPKAAPLPALHRRLCHITPLQLLTHSSGLLAWYPLYTQTGNFYEVLDGILEENPPVSGTVYSDFNYILLGRLLQYCTGLPLQEALGAAGLCLPALPAAYLPSGEEPPPFLQKAGSLAISSYGNPSEEQMCAERGLSYSCFRSTQIPVLGQANDGNCWYYFGGVSGHAGLFAPAAALVALGQRYLCGGLLAKGLVNTGTGRSLVFEFDEKFPEGCGHTGFTGPSLWLCPKHSLGMALLVNRLAFPVLYEPKDLTLFRKTVHETALAEWLAPRETSGPE